MQDGEEINVVDIKRPYWLSKDVTFFETSFVNDSLELRSAFLGVDVVYYLTSTTLSQSSNENPIFDIQSNLCEAINLLELSSSNKFPNSHFLHLEEQYMAFQMIAYLMSIVQPTRFVLMVL